MAKPIVVGFGEILWDLLPGGRQMGGAPANFAFHAGQLGARGVPVSAVGEDELGREILQRLADLRLEREFIAVDSAHPTGTVTVQIDAAGHPRYTIHQDVAWDFVPMTAAMRGLARSADAVCFGTLAQRSSRTRQSLLEFLEQTRPECLRIFDVNLRQSYYSAEVIEESLRWCDVLKLNDQELPVLCGLLALSGNETEAVAGLTRQYTLGTVALTCGGRGSRLNIRGEWHEHPGYATDVVDTVGAGDAFTAALAMGLLRGDDPPRIQDLANRLASFVCSRAGATPAIPADIAS